MGDISVIPPGERLHCEWEAGTHRTVSCMLNLPGLLKHWSEEAQWPDGDPHAMLSIDNESARLGLRQVAAELLSPGFASTTNLEITLLFVVSQIVRGLHHGQAQPARGSGKLNAKQLDVLRSLLIESAEGTTDLAQLAQTCGMSARQLAETYRRTTGTTLRSFVANARIERAKLLLLNPQMLVKQVAFDSGFQTASAFVAAFRSATGATPLEYRARCGISKIR